MGLVHRHAAEPPLPDMACPLLSGMNMPRVSAVYFRQGTPEAVRILRGENQMHMIGHENPAPDAHPRGLQCRAKKSR